MWKIAKLWSYEKVMKLWKVIKVIEVIYTPQKYVLFPGFFKIHLVIFGNQFFYFGFNFVDFGF